MDRVKDMSLLNSKESHSSSSRSKSSSSSSSERNPPVAIVHEPEKKNEVEETKFKQRKKEPSVRGKKDVSAPPLGQKMTPIKPDDRTKPRQASNGRSRTQKQQHKLLDNSTTENSIEATTNDESVTGSAQKKEKRKMSLGKNENKNSSNHNKSTIILNHSEESSIEPPSGPSKTEASPKNAPSFYPSIGYVTPPKTKTSMTAYYHSSLAVGSHNEIPKQQKPLNPSHSRSDHASLINSFIETTKKEPLPKIKNEVKTFIRSPPEALKSQKNPTTVAEPDSSSIIKVEEGGNEKVNNPIESRRDSNQIRTIIPSQNPHKKSFYISGLINKQPVGPELFSKPIKQGKSQQLNIDKEILEHLLIRTSSK